MIVFIVVCDIAIILLNVKVSLMLPLHNQHLNMCRHAQVSIEQQGFVWCKWQCIYEA